MIKVYHANENIDRESFSYGRDKTYSRASALLMLAAGNYSLVAEVDTDDLDVAYQKTNHIDSTWTDNDLVTAIGYEHRSSHIGDIFELGDDLYVIASIGFDKI